MQPNTTLITITNNQAKIKAFLKDLVIKPRIDIHKWALITKQTPTLKIGYIGQHLTSLIVGMEGDRTGARGHDIIDGTEVKSCTKVDQVDQCKSCKGRVMRAESVCSHCGSSSILRKDDSKWLFSIKTKAELQQLTTKIERIFLLISDYPNFKNNDFSSIRFEAFEIYPQNPRMSVFSALLTDYYFDNYKPKADANRTTAPMNFHPYKFQFYMCNPIKVFSCIINKINTPKPTIAIQKYILPNIDRSNLPSENMPVEILTKRELLDFIETAPFDTIVKPLIKNQTLTKKELILEINNAKKVNLGSILPEIDEEGKQHLTLRNIIIRPNSSTYRRN